MLHTLQVLTESQQLMIVFKGVGLRRCG